jgi:hypothetical protein
MIVKPGLTLRSSIRPPKTPLSGHIILYSDSNGKLFIRKSYGGIYAINEEINTASIPIDVPWVYQQGCTIDSSLGSVFKLNIADTLGEIKHINIPSTFYEFVILLDWESGIIKTPSSWGGVPFPTALGLFLIKGCSFSPNEVYLTQVVPLSS